jgi:hypothetical protein
MATHSPKGKRRPPNAGKPGRKKGVPNKLTTAAKEAFAAAFERMGGVEALTTWGKKNRKAFYTLYARLIPAERGGPTGDASLITLNLLGNGVISTPEQAEAAYRRLCDDPDFDYSALRYALPKPPVIEHPGHANESGTTIAQEAGPVPQGEG